MKSHENPSGAASRSPYFRWALITLLALLAVLAYLLWPRKGPANLQNAQWAVLPFENRSGHQAADMIGRMAADWISRGLHAHGAKVISYDNIRQHAPELNLSSTQRQAEFGRRTGATQVILGSYQYVDDAFVLECRNMDLSDGRMLWASGETSCARDNPLTCISDLNEEIIARLALPQQDRRPRKPPRFEAYEASLEGDEYLRWDNDRARALYERAIDLDPDYLTPYINLIYAHFLIGNPPIVDSILTFLQRDISRLTSYEQHIVHYWNEFLQGNYAGAFHSLNLNFEQDRRDPFTNLTLGHLAWQGLNQPQKSIEILRLNIGSYDKLDTGMGLQQLSSMAQAHLRHHQYMQAFDLLSQVPMSSTNSHVAILKARSLIYSDRQDIARELLTRCESALNGQQLAKLYSAAAVDASLAGHMADAQYLAQRSLEFFGQTTGAHAPREQAHSLFLLGQYPFALDLYKQSLEEGIDSLDMVDDLAYMAACHAHMGHLSETRKIFDQLDDWHFNFEQGCVAYAKARLQTLLGDHEQALSHLQEANELGMRYYHSRYRWDFLLKPLFGDPRFQAIDHHQPPL